MELSDVFDVQFKKSSHRDKNNLVSFNPYYGERDAADHILKVHSGGADEDLLKEHGGDTPNYRAALLQRGLEELIIDRLHYPSVDHWKSEQEAAGRSSDLTDPSVIEALHASSHDSDDDVSYTSRDFRDIETDDNEYSTAYPGRPEYYRD